MLVYIHIPFCDSKCSYCAFNSYVDKFHLKQDYISALLKQLDFEIKRFQLKQQSIESIFIGGGTPSTLHPKLYKTLFAKLKPFLKKNIEITIEANPNSATYNWLEGMYNLGVNRVSFGVQSFNKEKLHLLNRAHNKDQAINAVQNAKKVGFKNISIDLIYATYGDTIELLKNDIDTAFSLPINHISAYALTIEENTPFEKQPKMADEKLNLTMFIFDEIKKRGFEHYEISNFGTYQSVHNKGYWQYKDYLGLGSGSVGKMQNERYYPTQSVENYIKNPLNIKVEKLNTEDIKIEKIFLGFRSCIGVDITLLDNKEQEKAAILVKEKKLSLKENILYNKEYLLADEIVLFITS